VEQNLGEEPAALDLVAKKFARSGYNAMALRCKAGDDAEFAECVRYAALMAQAARLPMLHVSRSARSVEGTPFAMTIREASLICGDVG
jgi:hypothetical protein